MFIIPRFLLAQLNSFKKITHYKMNCSSYLGVFVVFGLLASLSCSNPSTIGSDLLQEDQANLSFTDQIEIQTIQLEGEPVQTYSPFLALGNHVLGNFEDPFFGNTQAGLYGQLSLDSEPPIFLREIDSVVLTLAYDTIANFYGDLSQPFGLEVFRIEEDLIGSNDYFSDQSFFTEMTPLGSAEFSISSFADVPFTDYSSDPPVDTTATAHIRIPLDTRWADDLRSDSLLLTSDTAFQNFFKGLYLRPTISSPGMVSVDLTDPISRMTMYYRDRGTRIHEFRFRFNEIGNARVSDYQHDHANSPVGNAITNGGDSLVYLQSMAGTNLKVEFQNLDEFQNIVVNKAELELTVVTTENLLQYPPPVQIIVTKEENGERVPIDDVILGLNGRNPINIPFVTFGGTPVEEEVNGITLTTYRINISSHFQDILEGKSGNGIILAAGVEDSGLYPQIQPKAVSARRAIFYGPSHSLYPLKLNLTFTGL